MENQTNQNKFKVSSKNNLTWVLHVEFGKGYIYSAYMDLFSSEWRYAVVFKHIKVDCFESELKEVEK